MSRPPRSTPAPNGASARPPRPARKPAVTSETPDTPGKTSDRIAKVMARAGAASRRDAERMISEGRVTVNGKVIDSPALDVTPKDRITIDGRPLDPPEPSRLWLYHKPEGLVTSARDEQGRATVFDHLPPELPRVMTIGRLDLNSEGLLLLTNDGELKRRLELPSTGWLRKYRVRVNGRPEDSAFDPLRKGIVVDGESFQPMTVSLDRQQGANAWLTIGIREGKNREIRRAMDAVNLTVNRLIRVSYGPFQLGDLKAGEVSEVRPRMLKDQLGLTETPMPQESARPRRAAPQAPEGSGGRLGPAKGAGRSAPAARDKPGQPGPQTAARRTAKTASGARGMAASADRWLDRAERGAAPAKPAPAPKGGLSRGGARPEALDDAPRRRTSPRAEDAPARAPRSPQAPGTRPGGTPRGPAPGGKPRPPSGKGGRKG